ncbi:unnamed protein product, partial [Brenthis ino]
MPNSQLTLACQVKHVQCGRVRQGAYALHVARLTSAHAPRRTAAPSRSSPHVPTLTLVLRRDTRGAGATSAAGAFLLNCYM